MSSDSLFSLRGKICVVTGATGLLGREHCLALHGAGGTVVACDLDSTRAQQLASELGDDAIGIGVDVSDPRSLKSLRAELMEKFRRIDVLVNNAAVNDQFENPLLAAEQSKFENYPLEMWERMFRVNVTGIFLCCQELGSEMARAGRGSIINIASTYGSVAPDQRLYQDQEGRQRFYKSAAYPATKGAVLSLTRFLAAYWGERGVRVNALSPGGVSNGQDEEFVTRYSERTPLGRMATPQDYRGALVFLASDASSYATGSNLLVDGGWTAW